MPDEKSYSDIYNGARCDSYSWSQGHSDLEIQIKLTRPVKQEDINLTITADRIKVELLNQGSPSDGALVDNESDRKTTCLLDGSFEHRVDTESGFWLLDSQNPDDQPVILIYLDKAESLWWQKLILDETPTESGPRNYTVMMDNLDDGSRMAIDKLIIDQRNKLLLNKNNHLV